MVGAHIDPAGVRGDIVDAVGHGLAQLTVGEIAGVDLHRFTLRLPFAAVVLEEADQFLLLHVHTDHRSPVVPVVAGLLVEVVELGVPVGVLLALQGLGVALQAEALVVTRSPGIHRSLRHRPASGGHCACRKPHPCRSRRILVLVEDAVEALAPSYVEASDLLRIGDRLG